MAIKKRIQEMSQYKPPLEGRSTKDYLLLDFNERTIPPSQKVKDALKKIIDSDKLQVYPEYGNLESKIAEYAEVKTGQIIITNGGDQGIDVICRAHLDEGDKVIIPFPAFPMHHQSSAIQGAEILEPRYGENGDFPTEEVLNLISTEPKLRLIILCNPNNPTGVGIPISDVEKILIKAKEKDVAVLHDEAYFEFSGLTCKDLIEKYDNLYIIRTFSKAFGLVAARVGYVISNENNIQALLKIRGPYDVNMFAKTAILAALEDTKYIKDYTDEVMNKSKPELENFLRKKGIKFLPSSANFLLLRVENPEKIVNGLKERGILVRPKEWPDGAKAVRVSIGTLKDTGVLIRALGEII